MTDECEQTEHTPRVVIESPSNDAMYFCIPLENGRMHVSIPRDSQQRISNDDITDALSLIQTVTKKLKRELRRSGETTTEPDQD